MCGIVANAAAQGDQRGAAPESPRATVDVRVPALTGPRIEVRAGGSLQAALDEARPGDVIALEPGATYRGPFRLRRKEGDGWIQIVSMAADRLPPPGVRASPGDAPAMPHLVSSSQAVVIADQGAHHYRITGVRLSPAEGVFLPALVELGAYERSVDRLPHHIVLDRCFLHGDPARGTRRGVALNSRETAIVDSYLAEFKEAGADSQAIAGWNGPGPYRIANNYLSAAGETIMFGGADPAIADLVPSDIEIVGNYMTKPLRWKEGHPSFEGTAWTVKNLFELKNARRVRVDGNLLEHNWPAAQNGFAILFTVRNQKGDAPWSVVEDVIFENNLVRRVGAGINILGYDDNHPSRQTRRIAIRNNLFLDVGGEWGSGRLFQLLDGTSGIAIEHNTAVQTGSVLFGGDGRPHQRFVFAANVAKHNQHGIIGSGTAPGRPTIDRYFPGSVFRGNVIVGTPQSNEYPSDTVFAPSLEAVGVIARDDGSVAVASARKNPRGDIAREPGATVARIVRAMDGVTSGRPGQPEEATLEEPPAVGRTPSLPAKAAAASATLESILWASVGLVAYVYVGYPLLVWARARRRPAHSAPAAIEPAVTIVVVAHNEAGRIGARIENLLALDYPADQFDVIVGSDGSTDDTVDVARRYASPQVTVRAFRAWRGKPAVLDDLVAAARGEIVVFADARQRFDSQALRALVPHFADPAVGAVSGELMLASDDEDTEVGRGTAFYWRYEKFIRASESRLGSTVGATGAIYAIRRSLFEPIPADTLLDDVLIPLRIVRHGYRVLFEPAARAFDTLPATARQEYVRKVRTIAGNFQLFAREPWLFNPAGNPVWFQAISHKALRLLLPVLHAAALAVNVSFASASPFYAALLACQVAFYGAALAGHLLRHRPRRPFALTVPYAMCLMTWATIAGFVRFLTHRQRVTWEQAAPATGAAGPRPKQALGSGV